MYLSILILFVLLVCLWRNFEVGFVSALILSPLLSNFAVFGADVYTYISIASVIIFTLRKQHSYHLKGMPLHVALVLYVISTLVTGFFYGEFRPISIVMVIVRDVINLYIAWILFRDNPNVFSSTFYKVGVVFAFIVILYTGYELFANDNPFVRFVNTIGAFKESKYIEEIRYGFKRCQALFSMHTTLGGMSLLLLFPLVYMSLSDYRYNKKVAIFLIFGMVFISVASGARSAMVGTVIGIITLVNKKYIKLRTLFLLSVIIMFASPSFIVNLYNDILASFTDTQSISGSNSEMRADQYAIAFYYLNQSPIFGNGIYAWTYIAENTDLYGAESIWLGLMIDRGLTGIVTIICLIILECKYVIIHNMKNVLWYIVAVVVLVTMTSVPMINFHYFFIPLMVMAYCNNKTNIPEYD